MRAAALFSSHSRDHAAPLRFALALAISAFAHAFVAQSLEFDMPRRAGRPGDAGTITVRIAPPAPAPAAVPALPLVATRARLDTTATGRARAAAQAATSVNSQRDPIAPPALPQAPDPTVYAARDLDVYPRPAAPLDFGRLGARDTERAASRFRVVLLIDEGGAVNEITVVEADPPGRLQEDLRATLAAIRFFPGQKDGRAVKSRLLLSVTLDPAGAERAGR